MDKILLVEDDVRALGVIATFLGSHGYDVLLAADGEEALRIALEEQVPCVVFGGRVEIELEGAEMVALSGDPRRAAADLLELGRRLGQT
jgi:DNA-binding response OmpR family regulator